MLAVFNCKLRYFEMRNGRSDDRKCISFVYRRRNIGEGFRIIFISYPFCLNRIRVENSGEFNTRDFLPQFRMDLAKVTDADNGDSERHYFLRGLMMMSPSIQEKSFSLFVTRERFFASAVAAII